MSTAAWSGVYIDRRVHTEAQPKYNKLHFRTFFLIALNSPFPSEIHKIIQYCIPCWHSSTMTERNVLLLRSGVEDNRRAVTMCSWGVERERAYVSSPSPALRQSKLPRWQPLWLQFLFSSLKAPYCSCKPVLCLKMLLAFIFLQWRWGFKVLRASSSNKF
jgi:hypothetical protein